MRFKLSIGVKKGNGYINPNAIFWSDLSMNPSRSPTAPASATALLAAAVDYAGLFPPAALDMRQAVAEYAAARAGGDAWLLGRFVTPAARLPEFVRERTALPGTLPVWPVSAIVGAESGTDLTAIAATNASASGHSRVDALECQPASLDGIDWLADRAGACEVFVEIPAGADVAAWMARIAARRLGAKIRTGGVTAAAFPSAADVVAFLDAATRAGVRFKATAGLHHAVRGAYRLTYEPAAPQATMFGYLNVLLAAASLRAGHPTAIAEQVLLRDDTTSLTFADDAVRWGALAFPTALVSATRASLAGFGSCSFREPADELRPLAAVYP